MSSLWKSIDPVDSIIFPGARMKSTYDEDGARSRGTPTRPLVRRLRSVTKVAKGYDLVRRLSSHTPPIPFPPRPPPRRRHTVRGRARHRGRRVQDAPALAPVPRPRRVVFAPVHATAPCLVVLRLDATRPEGPCKGRGVIVYAHGNAVDIGAVAEEAKAMSHHLHCHVIVPEYPGYGVANGKPCEVRSIHWSPYDRVRVVNADP